MIYRAPFLNVTAVGNYRLNSPMPWHLRLKPFNLGAKEENRWPGKTFVTPHPTWNAGSIQDE